jgi:hypothetical protein
METDTVTASGTDNDGVGVSGSDSAMVTVVDVPSAISVDKSVLPTSVDEPEGVVTFTVSVTNLSAVDVVTIDSLSDTIYGDLTDTTDEGNSAKPQLNTTCSLSQDLQPAGQPGASYTCTFQATVSGNAAGGLDDETDEVTASGTDDDGNPVSANDPATVSINNVNPDAVLTKIATQAVVTYQVTIVSTSNNEDPLTVTDLTDNVYGDLLDNANNEVSNNTCPGLDGAVIQPGAEMSCTFDAVVVSEVDGQGNPTGNATVTDTVTGTAYDDENTVIERSDSATVNLVQ